MTIYIINGDIKTSLSQKGFLETQQYSVEIKNICEVKSMPSFKENDIVLMDINIENSEEFSILDNLIRAIRCPKLLITTFENHIFRKGDTIGERPYYLLLKPFTVRVLLKAVQSLQSS